MFLPLDFRTQTRALQIARRLAAAGNSLEGLSLIRELLAGLVNSNQILEVIEAWIAAGTRASPTSSDIVALSRKLPAIVEAFAASGYAAEAVRVMATGVGLDPAMSGPLIKAVSNAFGPTKPRIVSAASRAAARELTSVGMDVLKAGNPEGIILMGAAQTVGPELKMPVDDIFANLDNLPSRQPVFLDLAEAQTLTKAAYDLHFSGRQEPAVRVGTMVPAMISNAAAAQLIARIENAAKSGNQTAFRASRQILDKGYAAEAVNLLVDSDTVSSDEIWASLHEEIRGRSQDLKSPGVASFAVRSAWSGLARRAQVNPPGPSFFFELKGEGVARCNEALWGKAFDLVFRYDLLTADALAGVKGIQFDPVIRGQVDLGIDIVPEGLTLTDGGAGRLARFKGGKMVGEPPRFGLRAPEKSPDVEPEPRGVQVVFTVAGSMIYSFFLAIRLVDVLTDAPCDPGIIDLDIQAVVDIKVEQPRVARIYCISKGDSWMVYGTIDGRDLTPDLTTLVSAAKLADAYKDGTLNEFATIAGDAIWRNIGENLEGPDEDGEHALANMKLTAAAGSKLYRLFSADPVFGKVLGEIETLPEGSNISFITNGTAFPWEMFYPIEYVVDYPPDNFQPKKFWGYRFVIESLLITTTEDDRPPLQRQQPGKLRVSMGLNSSIDAEAPWQGRPLLPVQLQINFFDASLKDRGGYFDKYDEIFDTLREPYSASLIYYFCHGAANQLKFDGSKSIFTPVHVMGASYPGWPIVFVNACDAGDISPLSFFSFRTRFRTKKAAGLIAPSFPIPTMFAAVFGKAFMARYVDQQPVGRILFNWRRQLLEKNNPLGLWYSLQCPLDVRAPEN
jgi:hypothetical protein